MKQPQFNVWQVEHSDAEQACIAVEKQVYSCGLVMGSIGDVKCTFNLMLMRHDMRQVHACAYQ